jgi:hypothetical protein
MTFKRFAWRISAQTLEAEAIGANPTGLWRLLGARFIGGGKNVRSRLDQ